MIEDLSEDEVLALLELGLIDLNCRVRQPALNRGWVILGDVINVKFTSRRASVQACERMQARFKESAVVPPPEPPAPPPPPAPPRPAPPAAKVAPLAPKPFPPRPRPSTPALPKPPPAKPAAPKPVASNPIAYADLSPNIHDADTFPPFPVPVRVAPPASPAPPPPTMLPASTPAGEATSPPVAPSFTPGTPTSIRKWKMAVVGGIAAGGLVFAAWHMHGVRSSERIERRLGEIRALALPQEKIDALLRLRVESGRFDSQGWSQLKAAATNWVAQRPLPSLPKEVRDFSGRPHLLETAIRTDFATPRLPACRSR